MIKRPCHVHNNQKGLATIEALPLVVVFVVLITYGLGLFGFVHTAILHSIGARTYAFETFRNRTNVSFFRDQGGDLLNYAPTGYRFHAVVSEADLSNDQNFFASERPLAFGRGPGSQKEIKGTSKDHSERIYEIEETYRKDGGNAVEVSPGWVMVGYGICVTANCGE